MSIQQLQQAIIYMEEHILMRQTLLKAIALCRTDVPNPYFTECSEPFNGQSGH